MTKADYLKKAHKLYLVGLGAALQRQLRAVVEVSPNMRFVDQIIGFTKNINSTTIDSVVRGDLHLIGNAGDKAIVVYALAKHVHYGLLDDEDDYVIQPIDVDELVEILTTGESEYELKNRASRVIEELDKLLRANS